MYVVALVCTWQSWICVYAGDLDLCARGNLGLVCTWKSRNCVYVVVSDLCVRGSLGVVCTGCIGFVCTRSCVRGSLGFVCVAAVVCTRLCWTCVYAVVSNLSVRFSGASMLASRLQQCGSKRPPWWVLVLSFRNHGGWLKAYEFLKFGIRVSCRLMEHCGSGSWDTAGPGRMMIFARSRALPSAI